MSVQSKSFKGPAEKLKEKFNYSLKEDNGENWLRNSRMAKYLVCKNACTNNH